MAVVLIPQDIKGLTFKVQVSWAAGDPGGVFTSLRAFDIDFKPTRTMHTPAFQKPEGNRGPDKAKGGAKGGTLTFKTYLRGGKGAMSDFITLAQYCGMTLHTAVAGPGVVLAGAGVDTIIGTTVNIGAYVVGDAIFTVDAATGLARQIRFVSKVDDTTNAPDTILTVEPNWVTLPVVTDHLLAIDTLFPEGANGEPGKYMCFKGYSGDLTDVNEWTFIGCSGKWKLADTNQDQNPVIEWEYQIDSWSHAVTAATQGADAYNPAHPLLGDLFFRDDTQTKISLFGFDPGRGLDAYVATEGANGRAGWLYQGCVPVPNFMSYWDDDLLVAWLAETEYQIFLESIIDDDEAWAIYVPAIQILNMEEGDLGNNHVGAALTIQVNDPGKATNIPAAQVNIPIFSIAVTGA